MRITAIQILFIVLLSCQSNESNPQLQAIDVAKAFENKKGIPASKFISELEYVRLETSNETLYKNPEHSQIAMLQDTLIFLRNFRVLALFDRTDGSFIKHISHFGESPNAYRSSTGLHRVRNSDTLIYATGKFEFLGFDINTGLKKLSLPYPQDSMYYQRNAGYKNVRLNDSSLVMYFPNGNGDQKLLLMTYTNEGQIIHFFLRKLFYENDPNFSFWAPKDVLFYKTDDNVFFKEAFNDTVFHVQLEKLIPKYRFDLGSLSPDYRDQERLARREHQDEREQLMFISNIMQKKRNIIFNIKYRNRDHLAYHDLENKVTQISRSTEDGINGFINDIDGFIPFSPNYIDSEGNFISSVPAEKVYNWFQNNKKLIDALPPQIRQLRDIKPEDNPLVMIGR